MVSDAPANSPAEIGRLASAHGAIQSLLYRTVVPELKPVASAPFEALHEAADGFAAEDVATLSNACLGDELVALRRLMDRLEAESCRRIREFDKRRAYLAHGATSVVSWLRQQCGMSGAAAFQSAEVARNLGVIADAGRALDDGEIGFGHAVVLARSVSELGKEAARAGGSGLVDAARRVDPDELRRLSRSLRHVVDPDGALRAALQDHARRRLSLTQTLGGAYLLDGVLGLDDGATLRTALETLVAPLAGDGRSGAQRRADALVEMAARHLRSRDAGSGGGKAQLMVSTSAASAPGDRFDTAEIVGVGAIPKPTARRLTCDCGMSAITVDAADQPLNVGRTRRSIPSAIRRALEYRDRGCGFPGCDRPIGWTEAHHVRHWLDGGLTSMENLVLLCRCHHRMVHEDGWTLTARSGGGWRASPP